MGTSRWRILLPLGYMAAIYALSSISDDQPDTLAGALFLWVTPQWQNLLHVPLYAGLTLSWIWALGAFSLRRHKLLILAFLLTALWGLLDEVHQAYVPGRFASITDMLLNVSGAILAIVYFMKRCTPVSPLHDSGRES